MKFSEFLGGTYMLENGKPELLVPASSLEVLKVAVMYGADAVYIGGSQFGARAYADNLDEDHMLEECTDFAQRLKISRWRIWQRESVSHMNMENVFL